MEVIQVHIKLVWMCLTAVCTATFVYSILHELGHLLVMLFMGAKVVDFFVFPTSYVMVNMVNAGYIEGSCCWHVWYDIAYAVCDDTSKAVNNECDRLHRRYCHRD